MKNQSDNSEKTRRKSTADVLQWLESSGSKEIVQGMTRYGIPNNRAFGIQIRDLKAFAKRIGPDHDLALSLWETGWYEARNIAIFIAEDQKLTADQMDAWAADFDNWAICDTACFHLFDRSTHAWEKVQQWVASPDEFVKRAGFAMIWALSVHDKSAPDSQFEAALRLIESAGDDERLYVRKAIDMALRATGKRNAALHCAAIKTAESLAGSDKAGPGWIGKKALKELESDRIRSRFGQ